MRGMAPKENKKLRQYSFVHNKLTMMERSCTAILYQLGVSGQTITRELIVAACLKIDPQKEVFDANEKLIPFHNWYEYLESKATTIKGYTSDLLVLSESLDAELLSKILEIENIIYNFRFKSGVFSNENLSWLDRYFYDLIKLCYQAHACLRKYYLNLGGEKISGTITLREGYDVI